MKARHGFVTRRRFITNTIGGAAAVTGAPAVVSALAMPGQGAGTKVPWYRRAYLWGQTNITEKDPIRYDIDWWRGYWKRTRVQAVIINAGGIVAYYPSKYDRRWPLSAACSLPCETWPARGRDCTWSCSLCDINCTSWSETVLGECACPRSIAGSGSGCLESGWTGGERWSSWSGRPFSGGTVAASACSGRGRAVTARVDHLSHGRSAM